MVLPAGRHVAAADPVYGSGSSPAHSKVYVSAAMQAGQWYSQLSAMPLQLIQRAGQTLHLRIVKCMYCISCLVGRAEVLLAERLAAAADPSYGSDSLPAHSKVYISAAR